MEPASADEAGVRPSPIDRSLRRKLLLLMRDAYPGMIAEIPDVGWAAG